MPSLIAIDMPAGQRFVDELKQIWDSGDALLPIDQRLPHIAKNQLLKQLGASYLINHHGERLKLEDGFAVGANDALVIPIWINRHTQRSRPHSRIDSCCDSYRWFSARMFECRSLAGVPIFGSCRRIICRIESTALQIESND